MNRGRIIVLSGPSGVGKTTLCKSIINKRPDIRYSISATSRKRRKDEIDGREYIFLTEEEFKRWIEEDRFVEYASVHGNLYGTPRSELEGRLEKGVNVLMDIDVQGAKKMMSLYPDGIYIFIIPPDISELQRRLLKRKTEQDEVIKNRLANALKELEYKKDFQYVVENRDLDKTKKELIEIIEKELGPVQTDRRDD